MMQFTPISKDFPHHRGTHWSKSVAFQRCVPAKLNKGHGENVGNQQQQKQREEPGYRVCMVEDCRGLDGCRMVLIVNDFQS